MAHKIRDETNYLVVHCSDTYERMNWTAKDIDRCHRQRGFLEIGYHYVICRDGTVEDGRDVEVIGAHAKPYNQTSVGVCMIGGRSDDDQPVSNYTDQQWYALEKLLCSLRDQYPEAEVVGHNDLNHHKACPCFDVKHWSLGVDY